MRRRIETNLRAPEPILSLLTEREARMPALTRPHRQAIATVALVAFTVAPTVYVAMTAIKVNRPGHVRDVEIEVGRQLGVQVTLEGVRYPRPGEVAYRGVVLRQQEPGTKRLAEVAR